MLARYLDRSYVRDPMALIVGLSGTFDVALFARDS